MKRITRVTLLLGAVIVVGGATSTGCCIWPVEHNDYAGPVHEWAEPVTKPGLEKLYRVSDTLYRGAQPTAEGMKQLKVMGVKTVVNLRTFHSDRDEIGDLDLGYVHIRTMVLYISADDVVEFLRTVADKDRQPVFVHCLHGVDRTGVMSAVYRIAIEGWSKAEALDEMVNGPFGHNKVLVNLHHFINDLDIGDIKRRAGLDN